MSKAAFRPRKALVNAVQTVLRDRRWPLKLLAGGVASSTLLGHALTAGYEIEHVENTHRGFPYPLPMWADFSTKLIMGILATVIDFTYLIAPMLLTFLALFCALTVTLVTGDQGNLLVVIGVGIGLFWPTISFLLGLSPIAKTLFAEEGDIEAALSKKIISQALRGRSARTYAKARIASLPAYLPFALAMAPWWWVFNNSRSFLLLLAVTVVLLAALMLAHLIVMQIYIVAAAAVRRAEFEARLEERRKLFGEQ